MRKIILLLAAMLPFFLANAENYSNKDLKRFEKDAKKQAKEYRDWKVLPGALPIERQLEEAYKLQYAREDGEPKYIIEEGVAVAQNYNAAKLQAVDAAKLRIAANMETEIVGLIESGLTNKEISTQDAASISEIISGSKSKIAQSLGRVTTVVELYRDLPNKTVRVMVRLAYSSEQARAVAKKVLYQDMED